MYMHRATSASVVHYIGRWQKSWQENPRQQHGQYPLLSLESPWCQLTRGTFMKNHAHKWVYNVLICTPRVVLMSKKVGFHLLLNFYTHFTQRLNVKKYCYPSMCGRDHCADCKKKHRMLPINLERLYTSIPNSTWNSTVQDNFLRKSLH